MPWLCRLSHLYVCSASAGQVAGWGCLLSAGTNSGWVRAAPGLEQPSCTTEEHRKEKSQALGLRGLQLQRRPAV